jgi:hypothetical protein
MDYQNILQDCLKNYKDEFCGFQYYNVCKNAAIIKSDDSQILASTEYFKVKEKLNYNNASITIYF